MPLDGSTSNIHTSFGKLVKLMKYYTLYQDATNFIIRIVTRSSFSHMRGVVIYYLLLISIVDET